MDFIIMRKENYIPRLNQLEADLARLKDALRAMATASDSMFSMTPPKCYLGAAINNLIHCIKLLQEERNATLNGMPDTGKPS